MTARIAFLGSFSVLLGSQFYHYYRKNREEEFEMLYQESPDKSLMLKSIQSRTAPLYDSRFDDYEWAKRIDKYRKVLASYAEGKVLEIGIGTGRNWQFYNAGCRVIGIDWSQEMLDICDKKDHGQVSQLMLMLMDGTDLKFPDHTFDNVVLTFVLSSSHDPVKILTEALRVCKPTGRVLVLDYGKSDEILTGVFLNLYRFENLTKYGYDQQADIEKIVRSVNAKIEIEERKQGGHIYFYIMKPNNLLSNQS